MTPKQQINGLHSNERAVSPVIGVILMVAITVILAAVIGTFVLDLGQSVGDTGPTASLSFSDADEDYNASGTSVTDFLVLEHQGGDAIELQNAQLRIRNESSNDILLSWNGADGLDNANSEGTDDWTIEYNGNDITSSSSDTYESGDILVIKVDTPSEISNDGDNNDYVVTFIDQQTDTTVGQATLKLK